MSLLPANGMLPGLVVEVAGQPTVVTRVERNHDDQMVTLELNSATFDIQLPLDESSLLRVLGTSFSLNPDDIEMFES